MGEKEQQIVTIVMTEPLAPQLFIRRHGRSKCCHIFNRGEYCCVLPMPSAWRMRREVHHSTFVRADREIIIRQISCAH
jgi:hypothetical protein